MKSAFAKDVIRSIAHSKGRFIAILVIAALGVGFYAGLQMTAPDMKMAADEYFDEAYMSDLQVVGTMGLDDDSIARISSIDGVEAVQPEMETDAMAMLDGSQYAVRIHSMNVSDAVSSECDDGLHVYSDNPNYLNRLVLVSGSWPTAPNECLLSADAKTDTPVNIGDTVTVMELVGNAQTSSMLKESEFTVVGFVRTPYYVCSSNIGTTQLGDGSIDDFMMVPQESFNDDLPYTSAFVAVSGARELRSGSDEYKQLVGEVSKRIEDAQPDLSVDRVANIKADAQAKVDDGWRDYWDAKNDADAQLADAKATLGSSKATLDSSAAKLKSSRAQLVQGQRDYESGAAQLAQKEKDAYAQLDSAQQQIDQQKAALEESQGQLATLNSQLSQVESGIQQAEQARSGLTQQLSQLQQLLAYLQANPGAEETVGMTAQQVQAQIAQVEAGISQIDSQLQTLQGQEAQLQAGIEQIESGSQQLQQAQAQLDAQRQSVAAQFASARKQLAASKAQLDSGWAALASGQAQYDSGYAQYLDGLAQYNEQKAKAEDELANARSELEQAQADVDAIENPDWYVLDRTKNIGAESFMSDSDRIGRIASVFPFIFFLVAALVSLTTMTRMVDEERVIIGTYKALGYSNSKITSKYIIYAFIASIVGSVVGIIGLTQFLPFFIQKAYAIIYVLPTTPTPIDIPMALFSTCLGMAITLLATWWAAAASLREKPAALMLPRAPKMGKRILIERIRPLWSRMSFSWKVTARNIFRYKRRFFMAVIGIAGCTALLLTGFGLHDSINDIISYQYDSKDEIFSYSMTVGLDEDANQQTLESVDSAMQESGIVDEYTLVDSENMIADNGDREHRIVLVVPEDPDKLSDFVSMRNRLTKDPLSLQDGSAIVTEKLATEQGIGVGDTIRVYEENTIGDATGDGYEFVVGGIMENYVSNHVYVTPAEYASVTGKDASYRTIYGKTNTEDTVLRGQLSDQLLAIDGVETAGYNTQIIDMYRNALSSVDAVVYVLIVAAAVLAFVVLYNLTNINIDERAREIATLKVLGFTPREVDAYIFRETIILTIVGALLGLLLGIVMENFVVVTAEVEQVMFGRDIHALSFLFSIGLTLVFSLIVTVAMRRKLRKISMVDSLKSID